MKKKNAPQIAMLLCWLTYVSAYLGRYSYASSVTAIIEKYGVTHGQAGLVSTCFFFAYGIGQVISGLLCKRYPKRIVIPASLTLSAVLNLAIFLDAPFASFKYLWLLNGIVQSTLWSSLILILSETVPAELLNRAVVVLGSSVPVGTVLVYGGNAVFIATGHSTSGFLFAAVAMLAASVIWLCFYDRAFSGARPADVPQQAPTGISRALLPFVVLLGLLAVADNLVKDGLTAWIPSLLKEHFGLPDGLSVFLTLILPMLGLASTVCNTALYKKHPSFISLAGLWYLLALVLIGAVILFLSTRLWPIVLLLFGCTALSMYAINNIITTMAPLHMRDKLPAGLLAGVLDGCCYLGSTISAYGLGTVADRFGWHGVLWVLVTVCVLAFCMTLIPKFSQKNSAL